VLGLTALAVRSSKAALRPTPAPAPLTRAIGPRPASTAVGLPAARQRQELPTALAMTLPRGITNDLARRSPPPEPTAPEPPAVVQAAPPENKDDAPAGTCGTAINFIDNPFTAAQQAIAENKLLFVLHVSGDFDDPGFT
jgi:hypothetical protein